MAKQQRPQEDNDELKVQFLEELEKAIEAAGKEQRKLVFAKWLFTVLIALSGICAAGGALSHYVSDLVIAIIAGVSTIAVTLNHMVDPSKKLEFYSPYNNVLASLLDAVKFSNYTVDKANEIKTLAKTDPYKAMENLLSRNGEKSSEQ